MQRLIVLFVLVLLRMFERRQELKKTSKYREIMIKRQRIDELVHLLTIFIKRLQYEQSNDILLEELICIKKSLRKYRRETSNDFYNIL